MLKAQSSSQTNPTKTKTEKTLHKFYVRPMYCLLCTICTMKTHVEKQQHQQNLSAVQYVMCDVM